MYSHRTVITKEKGQCTIDLLVGDEDVKSTGNFEVRSIAGAIMKELQAFNKRRGWEKTHTPRNIVLCLSAEIGELSEIFQWMPDKKAQLDKMIIDKACQEIGDIVIYLLNLASACRIIF